MNEKERIIHELLKAPKITQKAPAYPIFVLPIGDTFLQLGKYLDCSYTGLVFKQNNGFADFSYLKKDFPKIFAVVKKEIQENPNFLRDFKKEYEKQFADAEKKYDAIKYKDDLINVFNKASDLIMYSIGIAHIIEPISILGTHDLKNRLVKIIKDPRELNRILNIITTPEGKSFSNEYDDSLFKVSLEKNRIKKGKLIQEHIEKYHWIGNGYTGSKKFSKKDVNSQLKSFREPDQNYFNELKKFKKGAIKEYGINKSIQELAEQLLFITSWQDERKIKTLKAITEMDKVLNKIAKKFKVSAKDLYLLMPEEISNKKFLENNFSEEVAERKKCFLWFFSQKFKNSHFLMVGDRAKKLYNKFLIKEVFMGDTLNGTCASTGSAIGKVSICKSLDDVKKFKNGDILVTSMTRPEFLPAMKRAVAVVTDEGGITCHAAIVSRELKIPCVIGTKNATQVLKSGDLIEVKADHGAVKILEKCKNK